MSDYLPQTPDVDELRMTLALERLGGSMRESISHLTGRVDQALSDLKDHRDELRRHDERLAKLEQWRWTVVGAAIALGGGAGVLTSTLGIGA